MIKLQILSTYLPIFPILSKDFHKILINNYCSSPKLFLNYYFYLYHYCSRSIILLDRAIQYNKAQTSMQTQDSEMGKEDIQITYQTGQASFKQTLQSILAQFTTYQSFLTSLQHQIDVKNDFASSEISSLALIVSIFLINIHEKQPADKLPMDKTGWRWSSEQLLNLKWLGKMKQKQLKPQLLGYIQMFWDKIMRYSCYKNILQVLILYECAKEYLFEAETQFARLLRLLTQSIIKVKIINQATLQSITRMIQYFISNLNSKKNIEEIRSKLSIVHLLFQLKGNAVSQVQINDIQRNLVALHDVHLQFLIDNLQKQETSFSLQEQIIWDSLFSSLLKAYGKLQRCKPIIKHLLEDMISEKLDLQAVKLLIKELQINNEANPLQKWKEIFNLINYALEMYPKQIDCLSFSPIKSYYKYLLPNHPFYVQLELKLSLSNAHEKIVLMVQDKTRNRELWVCARYENQKQIMMILLKLENNIIYQKLQQKMVYFEEKSTQISVQFNKMMEIKFVMSQSSQQKSLNSATLSLSKWMETPHALIIGDQNGIFSNAAKYLYEMTVYQNKNLDGGICIILELDAKTEHRGLRKKCLPSFLDFIRAVGDLDIFLMIISHAIRKLKKHPHLVMMIREAIHLLQNLVIIRKVTNIKLSIPEKQRRLNAILCLCWQCCSESCNAEAILELLRILGIRGVNSPEDELQILCNFVFWKHFEWQYQKIMIMKIKELFSEIRHKQNYTKYIQLYSRRILQETALYYREEEYILTTNYSKDNILKIHYEFIDLVKQQFLFQILHNKQSFIYYEFLQFCLKLLSWTLSRRNTAIDAFDITYAIQLSFLINELSQYEIKTNGTQQPLLRVLKCVGDVIGIYDQQQRFFQNKNIKIYNGQEIGYISYLDKIIKDNLNKTGTKLACLDEAVLLLLLSQQKPIYTDIYQLIWINQISTPITAMSTLKKHDNSEYQLHLYSLLQMFPLFFLTEAENQLLLPLYLENETFFNCSMDKVNEHLAKALAMDRFIQICGQNLKVLNKSESKVTIHTKQSEFYIQEEITGLKVDKILDILAQFIQPNYEESFKLLDLLSNIYPSHQYLISFEQTHTLQAFLHNIARLHSTNPPALFIQALITIPLSSQIHNSQPQFYLSREKLIQTLEYYFKMLNKRILGTLFYLKTQEEWQKCFEQFRRQIQTMINYLSSCQVQNIHKLSNFKEFLGKQLLPLSNYYLQQIYKPVNPTISSKTIPKEKAKPVMNKKHNNLQFPNFNFQQEAKNMYNSFLDERNMNLFKVQKVWSQVEQKNKYFWSTFIGKDIYYTLYEGTGSLNQKYLLKRDTKKPKLQLPRMQKASCFRSGSMSIQSQRHDMSQIQSHSSSSIFDMAHLYKKDVTGHFDSSNHAQLSKEVSKHKKIKVLLVTSNKIYQGVVSVIKHKLIFKENEFIDEDVYNKVFAAESEQRGEDECIKENYTCEEELTNKCQAIVKRYLFHDLAVEVHTTHKSYFFSFFKKQHRQSFLHLLEGNVDILSREKCGQEMKNLSERWERGFITNFEYLMHVNDLSGRTFNDLSQYYIFPWTITNFQQEITVQFFKDRQNFRDLSLPIGKIDKKKWGEIKKRYQNEKESNFDGQMPLFLYGSFYSNRAIVCNYLIRVYPFSTQHFQLQSNQFDLADRLFFSVPDSYKSLLSCFSDFKEMIPQFYYFPEFLKNRNSYDLGFRQNKDIVNNVALPSWASDEYQFIFRMSKILESEFVTRGLHSWIDLIFGVYAHKEHAIKADNLFLEDLYIEGYNKYQCEKDTTSLQFFKEFGQVPIPIFNKNHSPSKIQNNFLDSIVHSSVQKDEFLAHKIEDCGKIMQVIFHRRFTFILFQKQLRMYEDEKYGDKYYISINGDFESSSINYWEMFDSEFKKHFFILLHKRKSFELIAFQIRKNIFNKFNFQNGEIFPFKHKCELYTTLGPYIFCSENKNIYIYKNVQEEMEEDYSNLNYSLIFNISKHKYLLSIFTQFTQHKSKLTHLLSNQRNLVVTLDKENKAYIIEIPQKKLSIFNFFEIRNLFFEELVLDLLIHNMGYLILRTNYDRIFMYSFLGDRIIEKYMNFEKTHGKSEKSTSICIWNHQLSEIIVTTNLGNLWKIDLFSLRKNDSIKPHPLWMQKIYLNKEGIMKEGLIKANASRIGRQFRVVVLGQNNKIYLLRSAGWEDGRGELISKKEWKM